MRLVFSVLLFFLCAATSVAQQTRKNRAVQPAQAKQYVFTHLNSFNGLASNIVKNVTQDKRGYIWIATFDGLQRYDGRKFLTFRHDPGNPHSVPGNVIEKVFEDRQGNIWVLSENKIGIFNTSEFTFTEIPLQGNSEKDPLVILFIEQDPKGNATLFVKNKGIYTYDKSKQQFLFTDPFQFPKDHSFIGHYHEDASSQYWFASFAGMSMYDCRTKNINYHGHNPDNNEIIRQLDSEKETVNVFGQHGDVFWYVKWNLGEDGAPWIIAHNLRTGKKDRYSIGLQFGLGYFEVGGALHQRNGRVWVHGKGFLAEYTGGGQPWQLVRNEPGEQTIKFDGIYSMYEDRENNIWVASDNGLFLFNPESQLFQSYKLLRADGSGMIEGPAQCALQLDNGHLLVGTWGGGFYYYDSLLNPAPMPRGLRSLQNTFAVWSMRTHSVSRRIWLGLQGGGLIVYDPITDKGEEFFPPIMDGRTVRQITEDRYGNLWFGTQAGKIVKWDMKASGGDPHKGWVVVKPADSHYIFKLIMDNRGFIWAGSINNGLQKYDPVTYAELDHITSKGRDGRRLLSDHASDILQYNDSLLLIASGGINILNLNTGLFTYITSNEGLPANPVMCFEKDENGILWMGMMHGFCRGNLEKKIFTRYDRRDGLFFDNFFQAGAYRMNDGRLIFLTDHDFFTFNADRFSQGPDPPKPVITEFRVANKPVMIDSLDVSDTFIIHYEKNTVQIDFSGLQYLRQNKTLYFYQLEGFDKDWIPAGDNLQAIYSYLPPKKYRFRVKSENANGVSSAEATFRIEIQPPFWRTWWFYGLIALLAAGILYWIDRERVKRIVALQKMRTQIAHNLHQDINDTLNNINLLSEMAKIKADKDIDRSKEYIDQISEKSNNMIIAMDDMLWSIDPVNDNMEKTILRMKEFVEALRSRHGTGLQMVVDNAVRSIKIDMARRHELFLVFKEMLRDMVMRSPNGEFLISIDLVKSKLYLKILDADVTSDISFNSLTMTEMKRRAEAIGAELDIQPAKSGIAVVMLMPVK